jgi:uncharacterized membrane protein
MTTYFALKILHILSSTLLFGTGLGTAFSMWRAHLTHDARVIAAVARHVALADWVFTTPAVVIQPITGIGMAYLAGFALTSRWLMASAVLYVLIGACWIPVVWLQLRMRDLAQTASIGPSPGAPLPPAYYRYYRLWFILGWPAFLGIVTIFALMVMKPSG